LQRKIVTIYFHVDDSAVLIFTLIVDFWRWVGFAAPA
jgi:hypothetical protein